MPIQVLRSDSLDLEVLPEAGARIHRLRAFGHDLLRSPPDPEVHLSDPFFWGGFPLVPWSNRVPGGKLVFRGKTYPLTLNFGPDAIHGEGYGRPWSVSEPGVFAFEGGSFSFPWKYDAQQS